MEGALPDRAENSYAEQRKASDGLTIRALSTVHNPVQLSSFFLTSHPPDSPPPSSHSFLPSFLNTYHRPTHHPPSLPNLVNVHPCSAGLHLAQMAGLTDRRMYHSPPGFFHSRTFTNVLLAHVSSVCSSQNLSTSLAAQQTSSSPKYAQQN